MNDRGDTVGKSDDLNSYVTRINEAVGYSGGADHEDVRSILKQLIAADRKATLERLKENLPADRETFDIDFPERNQRKEDMNFGKAIGFNECLVEVTQLIEQELWLEIQQAHIDNTEQS